MANYINFEDVTYRYSDDKDAENALDGVSFSIPKGQFVAVLGHNGCGKSTVAKHINALLTPKTGKVFICGLSAGSDENIWTIRSNTGMVFQNPDNQIVASIVEDEVAFGAENMGIAPQKMEENIRYALGTVGMEDYRFAQTANLSGGQKQKISIAGILAMEPECIIFDEATAMLDPMGRREVMNTARKLNKKNGITVIFITHYMEEAIIADRVIVMNDGRVDMDGTPIDIFSNIERLKALKLDVPPMTELANRLAKRGVPVSKHILTVEDMLAELNDLDLRPVKPDDCGKKFEGNEVLRVENLTHIYSKGLPSEHHALNNVSFSVREGEFVCIIGHTGSGKSTLIQHLNGLILPDSGAVYYKGQNIFDDKKSLSAIRQHIGLVFQYPEHQLFEMTVYDDIAFGPKNMGLNELQIKHRVEYAAELTGLKKEDLERSPFELSGGQKRRAAIAGVLAMKPDVLVLDEPMAGLDPMGRDSMMSVISRLNKEEKITVLLVSHSMDDAAKFSDRILVMNGGSVEMFDTPEKVFEEGDRLKTIGLDIPYVSRLFNKLQQRGLPHGIITIDKAEQVLCRSLGFAVD